MRARSNLIASTGFAVLSPRSKTIPKFVSYICQSDPFTDRVTAESVGMAYPAIAESKLAAFEVVVPSRAEQVAIARFLDHADSRIQRLIRAMEKRIALLDEFKKSVISEAVTGRIDVRTGHPYSEYKDSGVKWLGEVPKHWNVRRLKTWLDVNKVVLPEDTDPGYELNYLDIGSVGRGRRLVAKPERIRFDASPSRARRVVKCGDTLVSTVRTYPKAVGFCEHPGSDLMGSTGFAVLSPRSETIPKFVSYVCQSDHFTDRVTTESVGMAYPAIAESKLVIFKVAVPSGTEQPAIATHLDKVTANINSAIQCAKQQIQLLREYRTRLIADVVTGKLDIRDAATRLSGIDSVGAEGDPNDASWKNAVSEFEGRATFAEAEDGGPPTLLNEASKA